MEKKPIKKIIELIVVSVAITSGMHFISTIIRNRYYGFLETIEIDPGVMHGKMCDEGVPGIHSVNRRILITNRKKEHIKRT